MGSPGGAASRLIQAERKIEKRYLFEQPRLSSLVHRKLVIDCNSGVATGKERTIGEVEVGLGPDGALQEGEEDVGDGLNGAEGEGVAATIHSRVEWEGAGLTLGEVGWADADGGRFFQQMVAVVGAGEGEIWIKTKLCHSPGAQAQAVNVQARDLDGDDSLQHQVERHGGALREGLVEGDLDGEGDAGAVLDQDGERLHADVVNGGRLRTPI